MTNIINKATLEDLADYSDSSVDEEQGFFHQKIAQEQTPIVKTLQEARLKSKQTLAQVSQSLRISQNYLRAIEEADLSALPERVYTLGFVRSYARYLDFDIENTIQRFKAEVLGDANNTHLSMPKPIDGDALPNRALIWLLTAILCGGGIIAWFYLNSDHSSVMDKSHIPDPIKQEIHQTLPSSELSPHSNDVTSSPTDSSNNASVMLSSADQNAPSSTVLTPEAEDTTFTAEKINTSVSTIQEESQPQIAVESLVSDYNLTFTELTWVEIQDGKGHVILNRNFKPGEAYTLSLKPGMLFTTGNAGGIQIAIGSGETFTLGKRGEILKNLTGDSERFKRP